LRALLLLLIACDAGVPGPQAPVSHPDGARELAERFDPAIVGSLTPRPVEAGTYGMAIDMSFNAPSTEVELRSALHGKMTLALAADGKASACVALYSVNGADPKDPYHQSASKAISLLTGTWSLVDGVAQIMFTAQAAESSTCDPANADLDAVSASMRCIATAATEKLPADAILCTETDLAPQLGMPTSLAERSASNARPRGAGLVMSRSGIHVEVEQLHAERPTFSFAPASVQIEPAYYLRRRTMF
jgi:hypothetical protein